MSVQESRTKLRRHGLLLVAIGGWKHDVVNKTTGQTIESGLTPEALRLFVVNTELRKRIERLPQQLVVASPAPVVNRRVWRI